MGRQVEKLSALIVSRAKARGYLGDGGGLYLQVSASGSKSWVFRFKDHGRLREMGLGSVHAIGLAEARKRATACRQMRLDGTDPIAVKKAGKLKAKLEAARAMTFQQCAEAYIEAHKAGWQNAKHAAQWTSTLKTYAYPVFGALPVQAIDVALIAKVLEPIWTTKTETASRLRGRIERVLDWATVRGFRQGENPARWRGHLDKLLPSRAKVRAVKHHAALPFKEIADFMARLREHDTTAARALEFAILTVARTSEVLGAKWDEIDLEGRVWTIPASRMKGGREHRVPLSETASLILKKMW